MNKQATHERLALPSALDRLDEIIGRAEGKELALFLDYDGTLTPIVSTPEKAVLSESMRKAVEQLAQETTVGVISGRALADVRKHMDLPGLAYAGDHGFSMLAPDGRSMDYEPAKEFLPDVARCASELEERLAGTRGARVERKDFSLAVHYRNVAEEDMARLREVVEQVEAGCPRLRFSGGKKVYDVKPRMDWDKGRALTYILDALDLGGGKAVPVYIGDDTTDEDAFRAIKGRGVPILVSDLPGETQADYTLLDPAEVEHFLGRLLDRLREIRAPEGPEALGSKAGARDLGEWALVYDDYRPDQEGLRESLTALGNGYFVTRGACFWASDDGTHYPGAYLAGGYNRLKSEIRGRDLVNEDLVNMPNWLHLSFRRPGGEWFSPRPEELSGYRLVLDLQRGVSIRTFTWIDAEGRRTKVEEHRLVHMRHMHAAAQCLTLTPLDWSGELEFRSALDGNVTNNGVPRYRALRGEHLEGLESGSDGEETVWLTVRTKQSLLEVAMALRTRAFHGSGSDAAHGGEAVRPERGPLRDKDLVGQTFSLKLEQSRPTRVEKVVTLFTSRDRAISEAGLAARENIERLGDFGPLLDDHAQTWGQIWGYFDIRFKLKEDDRDRFQMILHLYTFHLLQTSSPNTRGLDAGVPSRGWHGEAYRGHIFWDELFIFPLLNFRIPEITRSLLMYRYRRLREARAMAKTHGRRGAMYPWQSGSSGREESQVMHLNPNSGEWGPDNTHLQRHVNAAIAFNVSQYYQVTGDLEFMAFYGLEMLLEIARYWASLCEWNAELGRHEIKGVVGPDEYHEGYPWSDRPGLDNNFYTNFMAAWTIDEAKRLLELMPEDIASEVRQRVYLHDEELARWEHISERMRLVFLDTPDGRIPAQFEHYERLEEFDWQGYRQKYGDIKRLDRVLKAEGDTPNRFKASKQADVLMLLYLFSREEIERMFSQLGYPFEPAMIPRTIDYYLARTSHGSTLSFVVHARVLSRLDRRKSWSLFCEALKSDVEDIQGGTTPEGIHTGAMAGAVDIIQRGYTDMEMRGDVLWFNPRIPEPMERMRTRIRYRGHSLQIEITEGLLTVTACRTGMHPIRIGYKNRVYTMQSGDVRRIKLLGG